MDARKKSTHFSNRNCSMPKMCARLQKENDHSLWFIFDIHVYLWFSFFSPRLSHSSISASDCNFRYEAVHCIVMIYFYSTGLCLVSREYYSNGSFMVDLVFFILGHLLWSAFVECNLCILIITLTTSLTIGAINVRFVVVDQRFDWEKKPKPFQRMDKFFFKWVQNNVFFSKVFCNVISIDRRYILFMQFDYSWKCE